MSKRDQRDYEQTKAMLAVSEPNIVRINEIVNNGLQFHHDLWSENEEVRAAFRAYMEEHPAEFKARFGSSMFFLRILASHQSKEPPPPSPRPVFSVEDLEKMGLTDEQIEKLAGVNDEG
ncbi:MAG TPA: hypothetical protein VJ044_14095 [Candidatus Hodarchaeales archaeon]|nr:hypothetical protein [Candidatus Hodarchaeales archaeon]